MPILEEMPTLEGECERRGLEIERLRRIEHAARCVMVMVRGTHDHTKWFEALARLENELVPNAKVSEGENER